MQELSEIRKLPFVVFILALFQFSKSVLAPTLQFAAKRIFRQPNSFSIFWLMLRDID
jgi:hypothetical protein